MKIDFPERAALGRRRSISILSLLALLAAGCAQTPAPASHAPAVETPRVAPPLAYYQLLGRLNAAELARERSLLATLPAEPANQIRLAMALGHPLGQADTAKALALVEQILRSNEPAAVELHPLAQLLADQYGERLRLDNERQRLDNERLRQEGALERQGQLLKESQRKAQELQEKLKSLADIERSLSAPRPRVEQGAQGGQR
ncbi:MAG: permease [Azonexus sp.]|uniref:permease n=1 Tax=Azonexus sp. TaxID=1872668 RepID=UPI002835DCF8|nr:permease [Azonexus sp.]MDR0775044.1 permease [Azonexus sp.]